METKLFKVYAIPTPYDMTNLAGQKLDHVFVVSSDGKDWNCFGRGKNHENDAETRPIAEGFGHVRWASLIYGQEYEGLMTPNPAAGLYERYNGVCHNVANRILVLTGDDIDVRDAHGNELVTLLYGKFGFNIDEYVKRIKDAAAQVNSEVPGSLSEEDIESVLTRVKHGQSPDEEIEMLREDLEARLGNHIAEFDSDKKTSFTEIYVNLQKKRQEAFENAARGGQGVDTRMVIAGQLKPVIVNCLNSLDDLLGRDQYLSIFKVPPEAAIEFLIGN